MAKTKKKPSEKNRLITKILPKSPVSEQYRTVRTNIQFSEVDSTIRSLIVTAAGPGEGKTTTVSNLAVVFAQQGKRVLLIDADLRKPMQHNIYQLPNTIGLTNVLTRQVDIQDAIRQTDVPNLDVLTSGPIPPNPAELLGSASMQYLLKIVCENYDLVLLDTPPLLVVTDGLVLANQADAAILVLSSGTTDREGATKAKEMLSTCKAKLLGAILNNIAAEKMSNYYYYHYK